MRFIAIRKFNTHVVTELSLQSQNCIEKAKLMELGRALYPSFTLFNHSCSTPLARYYRGNKIVVTSVRSMKAGEKVPDTYGYFFADVMEEKRRSKIKETFWFDCTCEVCN